MGLTWEDFLQLAAVVTNVRDSIGNFSREPKLDIKEKNQKVAAAAVNYREFFNAFKYMRFMEKVRISFTKILKLCPK